MSFEDILNALSHPLVTGLFAFLGGIWAGRISREDQARIQKQSDQANSDRHETVSQRLAFLENKLGIASHMEISSREKESQMIEDIWRSCNNLIGALTSAVFIGPRNRQVIPSTPVEELALQRESELAESSSSFRKKLEHYKPYIDKSIYETAWKLFTCCCGIQRELYFPIDEDVIGLPKVIVYAGVLEQTTPLREKLLQAIVSHLENSKSRPPEEE